MLYLVPLGVAGLQAGCIESIESQSLFRQILASSTSTQQADIFAVRSAARALSSIRLQSESHAARRPPVPHRAKTEALIRRRPLSARDGLPALARSPRRSTSSVRRPAAGLALDL